MKKQIFTSFFVTAFLLVGLACFHSFSIAEEQREPEWLRAMRDAEQRVPGEPVNIERWDLRSRATSWTDRILLHMPGNPASREELAERRQARNARVIERREEQQRAEQQARQQRIETLNDVDFWANRGAAWALTNTREGSVERKAALMRASEARAVQNAIGTANRATGSLPSTSTQIRLQQNSERLLQQYGATHVQ